MKYLVAVSGGVDSVVLLDMLSNTKHHLIVAHVDHGIRGEDSAADARFVEALARQHKLPFVSTTLHLGPNASEDRARTARYQFLFREAKKYGAIVATAHHRDDLVETIALNLTRGTGWRGLAVLDHANIYRPLLGVSKEYIYRYALKNRLEWTEDATNLTDSYLRNRLRRTINRHAIDQEAVAALRAQQLQLKHAIHHEVRRIIGNVSGSRYAMTHIDDVVATELLGEEIIQAGGIRPTRPHLARALLAIKTALPGTTHHIAKGVSLRLTARNYSITVV